MILSWILVKYYLVIVFLSLAGYFKGILDSIVDRGIKEYEWNKKYDFTKDGNYKHWWYLGLYSPRFPERFPFSSTVLVFLTDSWHRAQFYMLRCFYLAISVGLSNKIWVILLLSFIVFPVIVGCFFEYSYNKKRK